MSDIENQNGEPEQGTDSGGAIEAGRRLREAREKAGIDINELGGRLRLTASHIAAMEEGRFDVFGARIYARGYVTNYARIVGLNPGPLLELLPRENEEPPLAPATGAPPGQRLAENLARVATYAIGTVVLALPVLWWASEGSLDALFGAGQTPRDATVASAERSADGAVEATEAQRPEEPAAPQGRPADDQPLMASMAMPRGNRQAAAEAPEAEAPAEEEPAGDADGGIVLEVEADSWVEIRDAAGDRLEYDLLRADTTHRYHGTAPYRVLIGNAEAVSVRYNGEPFDLAPYVQGNLARFEVGTEPADG